VGVETDEVRDGVTACASVSGVRTRVKVCCIKSLDEARTAVRLGADAVGLVGEMPSGPGPIPDALIAEIAATIPPGVASFLLTSRTSPADVVDHVSTCGTSVVQLVSPVPLEAYAAIRETCPSVRIVQVVHVEDESSIATAARLAAHVDAVLLDSGRPNDTVPQLGGTGRTHDWTLSRDIVRRLDIPVLLAGGLDSTNVGDAITRVRPFGVDLCSGVRTGGALDPAKLEAFMTAVGRADGGAGP
jgi:phosphoribosylanthranilate isomerase